MDSLPINTVILSLSLSIVAVYVGVRVATIAMVGDLDRIRCFAIMKIFDMHEHMELLPFLELLQSEQPVLHTSPDRSNGPLVISLAVFVGFSVIGIFSPLATAVQTSTTIAYVYIALYSMSAAVLNFFLWYDFRYYKRFRRLEEKFPVPADFDIEDLADLVVRLRSVPES